MIEKTRLEKIAQKIISEHDIYEGGYKFSGYTADDYIQKQQSHFSCLLKEIEKALENKTSPNTVLAVHLVNAVSDYLEKISAAEENEKYLVDVLRFKRLADKLLINGLGKNLEASLEGEKIGIFVLALTIFGSSANEAINSVAEWVGKKDKTVSAYYHNLASRGFWELDNPDFSFGTEEALQKSFLENHQAILEEIVSKYNTKPFPKRSAYSPKIKTYNAYQALVSAFSPKGKQNYLKR